VFAALLLVFSEIIVWQTPTAYDPLDWLALALIYPALAAITLDLVARLNVRDIFSVLLLAGIYGLLDATLISHITTSDLPLSLLVRPLGAQPLAFVGALAAFLLLASGRPTGLRAFVIALGVGLAWGVWVRWFPVVSDVSIPEVAIGTALAVLGIGLAAGGLIALALLPGAVDHGAAWRLNTVEWVLAGGVLLAALIVGAQQGHISPPGIVIVAALISFMGGVLYITRLLRPEGSLLEPVTPPRRPNIAGWLVPLVPLLLAGWAGYSLPGSGDSSTQSDVLIGVLTGFALIWLPAVSIVTGMRAFVLLARQGG